MKHIILNNSIIVLLSFYFVLTESKIKAQVSIEKIDSICAEISKIHFEANGYPLKYAELHFIKNNFSFQLNNITSSFSFYYNRMGLDYVSVYENIDFSSVKQILYPDTERYEGIVSVKFEVPYSANVYSDNEIKPYKLKGVDFYYNKNNPDNWKKLVSLLFELTNSCRELKNLPPLNLDVIVGAEAEFKKW